MHLRFRLVLSLAIAASLGCSGDRATGPSLDDIERAAAEFDRLAAELAGTAGPTAQLTYSSAAASLRGGARVSTVSITVGGVAEEWSAFGHEIQFDLPPGSTDPGLIAPPPLRALLAWRASSTGLRVIHLLSAGEDGPIGHIFPALPTDQAPLTIPSFLMYAERRDLLWQAVDGRQTSRLVSTGAACSAPPLRAPIPSPAPSCADATFTFGFSDVLAQPFALRIGPVAPPPGVSGTRTLSMPAQAVAGVKLKVTLAALALPPIASQAAP